MLLDALRTLNPAAAEFSAVPKEQCMKQTRVDVLESIIAHFSELGTRFVWLRGSPGTGKTAIAKSLCVTSGSDPHVTRNADMRRTSEAEPDG